MNLKSILLSVLVLTVCILTAWSGSELIDTGIKSTNFYKNKVTKDSLNKLRKDSIRTAEEIRCAKLDSLRDDYINKLICKLPKGKFVYTDDYEIFDGIIRLRNNTYSYVGDRVTGIMLFNVLNDTVRSMYYKTYDINLVTITKYKIIGDTLIIEPSNTQFTRVYKIPEGLNTYEGGNYSYKGILVKDFMYDKYGYKAARIK